MNMQKFYNSLNESEKEILKSVIKTEKNEYLKMTMKQFIANAPMSPRLHNCLIIHYKDSPNEIIGEIDIKHLRWEIRNFGTGMEKEFMNLVR